MRQAMRTHGVSLSAVVVSALTAFGAGFAYLDSKETNRQAHGDAHAVTEEALRRQLTLELQAEYFRKWATQEHQRIESRLGFLEGKHNRITPAAVPPARIEALAPMPKPDHVKQKIDAIIQKAKARK